jgi:hypothetical protein
MNRDSILKSNWGKIKNLLANRFQTVDKGGIAPLSACFLLQILHAMFFTSLLLQGNVVFFKLSYDGGLACAKRLSQVIGSRVHFNSLF